ncbi:hypothetical protein IAT40_005308 [Kwoniella sp. CBS 6097]
MLALRRSTSTLRPLPLPLSHLRTPVFREYHGDPGPSSSNHRQNRRTVLRNAATTGPKRSSVAVNADKSLLNAILDAPTPSPVGTSTRSIGRTPASTSAPLVKPLRLPTPQSRQEHNRPAGLGGPGSGPGSRQSQGRQPASSCSPVEKREETPYDTSMKLRRWITKHPKNLTQAQTEEVIAIVTEAKPNSVNAPVWNLLLGYMGRMQKFDRMWKLYNDMKKRGISPTSRTYSAMINAYAGASRSLEALDRSASPRQIEDRTVSRVTILFEQFQKHLKDKVTSHQSSALDPELDDELGLSFSSKKEGELLEEAEGVDKRKESMENDDEVDVAPINAYLKFLGRNNLFDEMQKIFISMDTEGPLSPDTVTYTTMFASLYHTHINQLRSLGQTGKSTRTDMMSQLDSSIGPTARGIWDRCVRQFEKLHSDKSRRIDNELLIHVLRCLLRGRPEDQRFALNLIHQLWSLPPPGQSNFGSPSPTSLPTSSETPQLSPDSAISAASKSKLTSTSSQARGLPKLEPNLESATALIQALYALNKPNLGTHYTTLLLSNPKVSFAADVRFLQSAMNVYASTGDVSGLMNLLDSFQISSGRQGWDVKAWRAAITGARWAGDFEAALSILRRAVHLPTGVEDDDPQTKTSNTQPYKWVTPNGRSEDMRGVRWVRPQPTPVDAGMLSNLLKTAMQKSNKEVKMALNIFEYLGGEKKIVVFPPTGEPLSALDPVEVTENREDMNDLERDEMGRVMDLVKTIERATERLGSAGGQLAYARIKEKIKDLARVWGDFDIAHGSRRTGRSIAKHLPDNTTSTEVGSRRHKEQYPEGIQPPSETLRKSSPDSSPMGQGSKRYDSAHDRRTYIGHPNQHRDRSEAGPIGRDTRFSPSSEPTAFDMYAELYPERSRSPRRSIVGDDTRRNGNGRGLSRDAEGGKHESRPAFESSSREGDRHHDADRYVPRKAFGSENTGFNSRSGRSSGSAGFKSEREPKAGFGFGSGGTGRESEGRPGFGSTKKAFGLKRD